MLKKSLEECWAIFGTSRARRCVSDALKVGPTTAISLRQASARSARRDDDHHGRKTVGRMPGQPGILLAVDSADWNSKHVGLRFLTTVS